MTINNYSLLLLLFTLTTTLMYAVNGKIPDYIQICKRNDPEINQCIKNSVMNLKDKLINGIPELDVPPIDPLSLEKLILDLGPGFTAEGINLILKGGKNFQLEDMKININDNNYTFNISIPEIIVSGDYEIDAKILAIPLKGRGPIHLTTRSVNLGCKLNGKKVIRNGQTYYWFPSMNLKISTIDYDIKLENLFNNNPLIGDLTNKLLNDEKSEILSHMIPSIEKALTEHILSIANQICKHFTWAELFPEL